ncbi:MAG: signal peptidase I [Clostridiales bacterium]|nr:signal peptidase I [Clostridiales bacterium]
MKKALNIIKSIFTWLVVALAVCMMIFTIVSVNTFDRSDRSIFGYKMFIVLSDSMSKTDFDAGDLVLSKEVDPSELQVGDIISYQSTNEENYGETVTHKIRDLTTDAEGAPGFVTYGTTTDTNDENIVTYSFVLGKYQTHLPGVGKFFQFLKTTPGYIACIFIPFLLLILMQGINSIRLFRKYKKEQQEELQAEKDKIEADRAETQKMMAELLAMKAELQGGAQGETLRSEVQGTDESRAENKQTDITEG